MGYRIPFLSRPPLSAVPIPMPSYNPLVHQRGCAWRGHPGFDCQGCGGACSASLPRLLQLSVCGVENLGHSSLDPQSLRGSVTFPDGDHPVCPAFCPSGGLDGLHRSQGGLPTGSHPSGISPIPPLCGTWPYLSVHSAVLWPLHGPAGFLPGHSSCFRHSPFLGYSHASIPRRLAGPVVLPRVSPPGPPGGTGPLSGAGHCHQPGEIQPRALSGCSVSRDGDRCPNFCGFSIARMHLQASINSWRISVLHRSSLQYLALAAGHAVLDVPSRPWRSAPHAFPTAVSPPVLGSGGSVNPDSLVSGLSSGSAVVAALAPPFSGGVSPSGVSRPGLLVRRLGHRLGGTVGPSHRFQPLEPRQSSAVHQRQGTSGRPPWSPPLPVISSGEGSVSILRQQHCSRLPSQGRGHKVSLPQLSGAGDPPLVGVALHPSGSPVYSGVPQCPGGHSVSPSPAASYRVVPQPGRVSIFKSSVASPD